MDLQDPRASMRRQIRSAQDWLPPGWVIVAHYWDIESGGMDLEERGHGDAYQRFADIPRDGGMADLLTAAAAPVPPFACVVCEDIERSARDNFASLKLEKELQRHQIPIFATDEPAQIAGANATTVLVRRVKQGVAEWYRLMLKEKIWKGLVEHSVDGWNIGPAAYGYASDKVTHPNPMKASQGRHKTRLTPDPVRGPVVTQIYEWRVNGKLSIPTITARLNADPAAYPPPAAGGWTKTSVTEILSNPKYTGYMVFGRTRTQAGKRGRRVPRDQWLWSPEPTHPALVDRATWDAAQAIGAERGNVRDPEMATSQPGRRYILRSRIRCRICRRRMTGIYRPAPSTGNIYVYYRCPHDQANPRHRAAHPGHPPVSVREDALMTVLAGFFDQHVFGPDRAALLAAQLPASAAGQAQDQARQAAHLRSQLARIDTAEHGLITELEQPADPADPATQAYRARIRARYAELYDERTRTEAQLAALQAATPHDDDPALLDELPVAAAVLPDAPEHIKQALFDAFDIQALYNKDMHQVTIWATLTDNTPQTITAILADPRTDNDTHPDAGPARTPPTPPAHGTFSGLGRAPIRALDLHDAPPRSSVQLRTPLLAYALQLVGTVYRTTDAGRSWHALRLP